MAENGFGHCKLDPKHAYKSALIERDCSVYVQAPDREKRVEWAKENLKGFA